jgi:AcrR family transcriptional regulator
MSTTQKDPGASDRGSSIRLRERQRIALRADIQQVALRLFATEGFDNVTTEAIAEEVGISPSTFFRHVPSKDYLLLGATQRGREQIVANFLQRPPDEAIDDSLTAAILARTSQFIDDGETMDLWRRAMASAPVELRRASLLSREDCDQLIDAVALRLGDHDSITSGTPGDIRAGVWVRSAVAAVEYAYEWWLVSDQTESLHDLTARALQMVTRSAPRGTA